MISFSQTLERFSVSLVSFPRFFSSLFTSCDLCVRFVCCFNFSFAPRQPKYPLIYIFPRLCLFSSSAELAYVSHVDESSSCVYRLVLVYQKKISFFYLINFNSYVVGCFHVSLNSLPFDRWSGDELVDDKSFNHEKLCSTFSHDLTTLCLRLTQFNITYENWTLAKCIRSNVESSCEFESQSQRFFFSLLHRNLIYRSFGELFHASTLNVNF